MFRELLKLLRRDNLLEQALHECYDMLDICTRMVHDAIDSLRNEDRAFDANRIYDLDKKVNAFEREVRRKVLTHLALGNKADVSAGLSLVSIVIDIERIGDYSKNIVDLARNHPARLHAAEHEPELKAVETAALGLLDKTVQAFKATDVDAARKLMHSYKSDVSGQCRAIEARLTHGDTSLAVATAVTTALYTRFLKRISAHSKNLISSIVNPMERIGYSE